jgi:uncharacterized protein YdeI (YjbR/CyaY-like superfamily)
MAAPTDLPIQLYATPAEWRRWLDEHHDSSPGVYVKIAKKGSGERSVTYAEALDDALCYGWIDGQKRGYDESFFLQRFTPRRKRSVWSKTNTQHVGRLRAAGLMQPAGEREVELAQADGRWDAAYESASSMEVPTELEAALSSNPKAKAFFDQLNKTNRYAVCWRVATARRADTRAKRVAQLVAMLERGETLH